jgi:tetratricopeptide (TPR) repeat protein
MPSTPYVYCRYCETVFAAKKGKEIITRGSTYHECDECGMFGRIRGYTEFYFYFLLVAYGFSYKERYLCDSCAHRMFVKTLLTNLIFILGVPSSIYAKLKSLTGREAGLKKLGRASALSRAGKYQQAAPIYQQIYQKHPEHPGLRMNEGIGHLRGNDVQGAMRCFEQSLKACGNYLPVIRLIRQMQQAPSRSQGR